MNLGMSNAFKEWALVCEALGSGGQSVIIRKGGIAEGRAGFTFKHENFFLFPTWFHEQLGMTNLPVETVVPEAPGEELEIRFAATVEWTRLVSDLDLVNKLREFHILQDKVVKERFNYDDVRGVHVAFVRVYRLDPPARLANDKKFGGCRSWIEIPDIDDHALVSVISDEEHERRKRLLIELLGE
jgi:hypothetical protein